MLPSDRTTRHSTEHEGRVFDVQPSTDDRSLDHPVRPTLLALDRITAHPRAWRRGPVLDQGQEGACVGHGVTQELLSTPDRVKFETAKLPAGAPHDAQGMAFWLYERAREIDEFPGEDYDGTSVNAGMKMARSLGLIDSWKWAHSRDEFRDSLIGLGPVVLAIPWLDGMYDAPGGVLQVSGTEVGWHCILANGYHPYLSVNGDAPVERVRLINSWGYGWGTNGQAWIDMGELWSLIDNNDGEMVIPIGRHLSAG